MRCLAVVLALAFCAPAFGATATIRVKPKTVVSGNKVRVHGTVPECEQLTLISRAFPHRHEFAGVPAIFVDVQADGHYSRKVRIPAGPGTYKITGRCGGGNIGALAKLTVTGY
jgi:hypothetical protein